MHGTITYFDAHRSFGLIDVARSTRRIFYHLHNVRLNQLGQQLPRARAIDSEVEFQEIAGNRPGRSAAMDIVPYEPFIDSVDLDQHRELLTLVRWIPEQKIGYAQRESGDWVSVSHNQIISEGTESLKSGSSLWAGIGFRIWNGKLFDPADPLTSPIDPKNCVKAVQVEIVMPTEVPAVEVSEIEESKSVLLMDRFKSIPLKKIGIRKSA